MNVSAPALSPPAVPRPLSRLLEELKQNLLSRGPADTTIGTLVEALHERGIGALMLLFAVPLALPTGIVPGVNTVFALPLIPLALQQARGRHTVWLPSRLLARTLPADKITAMLESAIPWIKKLEILVRPRLGGITQDGPSRLFGLLALIMALVASIPLPLTHTVPGIGLMIMAAGTTMRDGLAIMAGALIGMGWIIVLGLGIAFFGAEAFDIIRNAITSLL